MPLVKIVLPGDPVPQARPRMWMRGGKTMIFDPQASLKRELKEIAIEQWSKNGSNSRFETPRAHFWFSMPIPKSMNRNERLEALKGYLKHLKKPDVDNLLKLYMDVLTGVAWEDDNCVSIGSAVKVYGSSPRVEIIIEETTPYLTLDELWESTWPAHGF